MAHSYHHAVSSARKWGGTPDDYLFLHSWMDGSKLILADFRHRALLHHAEGCWHAERLFGVTMTNSVGRVVRAGSMPTDDARTPASPETPITSGRCHE